MIGQPGRDYNLSWNFHSEFPNLNVVPMLPAVALGAGAVALPLHGRHRQRPDPPYDALEQPPREMALGAA
jgi:hypothetical protein